SSLQALDKNLELKSLAKENNKRHFISTLVSHTDIPNELISFARTHLQLTNQDIFVLATRCANFSVMDQIVGQEPKLIQSVIKLLSGNHYGDNVYQNIMNLLKVHLFRKLLSVQETLKIYSLLLKSNIQIEVLIEFGSTSLSLSNSKIFTSAAKAGRLDIMNHLIVPLGNNTAEIQKMIATDNYLAFRNATEGRHLSVINRLIELVNNDKAIIKEMIAAECNAAFHWALLSGDLDIITRFLELLDNNKAAIHNLIKPYGSVVLQLAVKKGHLSAISHLIKLLGNNHDAIYEMLSDHYCEDFRTALKEKHSDVTNYLINFYFIYAHAEMHYQEPNMNRIYNYKVIVNDATKKYIDNLSEKKTAFLNIPRQTAHFDLLNDDGSVDTESALYGYYVLRHLIRVSQSAEDNPYGTEIYQKIEELLDIPSIKNLITVNALAISHSHIKRGFDHQPNELLRLAQSVRNERLVSRLLTIEAVRAEAEANNYYEGADGIDIAALARDRESSMTALLPEEQERLSKIETRYANIVKDIGGNEAVVNEFREYLEAAFLSEEHQSERTVILKGKKYLLPFEEFELDMFVDINGFSTVEIEAIDQVYFKNMYHSAYRYILKPNPWMDPRASYVYINDARTERWSTFEEYEGMIAYLWLAASDTDEEMKPTLEGMTVEDRINLFIKELSLIGRAHNWNRIREKIGSDGEVVRDKNGNIVEEEYDDLGKDRPSCFGGVKRRLFQALLGHPLYELISAAIILKFANDFVRDYYQTLLRKTSLNELKKTKEELKKYWYEFELPPLLIALNPQQEEFSKSVWKALREQFGTHADFFERTVRGMLNSAEKNLFLACHDGAKLGELLDTVVRHKTILSDVTQKCAFDYLEEHPQQVQEVKEKGITIIWNEIKDNVKKEVFEKLKVDFADKNDPQFKVLYEFIEQAKDLPYIPGAVIKAPVSSAASFTPPQDNSAGNQSGPSSGNTPSSPTPST
ncbi:MAG: hypothetical protein JSS53_02825, partial [Proteobacteria bacterium]|nr:hypothetical protein [Pseudomonadota bacterium]